MKQVSFYQDGHSVFAVTDSRLEKVTFCLHAGTVVVAEIESRSVFKTQADYYRTFTPIAREEYERVRYQAAESVLLPFFDTDSVACVEKLSGADVELMQGYAGQIVKRPAVLREGYRWAPEPPGENDLPF